MKTTVMKTMVEEKKAPQIDSLIEKILGDVSEKYDIPREVMDMKFSTDPVIAARNELLKVEYLEMEAMRLKMGNAVFSAFAKSIYGEISPRKEDGNGR